MEELHRVAEEIERRVRVMPRVAISFGGGIAHLKTLLDDIEMELPLAELPGNSPEGGALLVGKSSGVPVALLDLPLTRGNGLSDVAAPLRMLRLLGIEIFLLASRGRAVRPEVFGEDLLLAEDHLNLTGWNPLVGENLEVLGPRFPDMSDAYDAELRGVARHAAEHLALPLHSGVYAGISRARWDEFERMDPLDLKKEYETLRRAGADLVGIGLVSEVIVARHMGARVLGIAFVEDDGARATLLIREIVKEL